MIRAKGFLIGSSLTVCKQAKLLTLLNFHIIVRYSDKLFSLSYSINSYMPAFFPEMYLDSIRVYVARLNVVFELISILKRYQYRENKMSHIFYTT